VSAEGAAADAALAPRAAADFRDEAGNVAKCLALGATRVAVISSSPAGLRRIESAVRDRCPGDEATRVASLSPAETVTFLDGRLCRPAWSASCTLIRAKRI